MFCCVLCIEMRLRQQCVLLPDKERGRHRVRGAARRRRESFVREDVLPVSGGDISVSKTEMWRHNLSALTFLDRSREVDPTRVRRCCECVGTEVCVCVFVCGKAGARPNRSTRCGERLGPARSLPEPPSLASRCSCRAQFRLLSLSSTLCRSSPHLRTCHWHFFPLVRSLFDRSLQISVCFSGFRSGL